MQYHCGTTRREGLMRGRFARGLTRVPAPSPATAIAVVALLVATAGTAWGVTKSVTRTAGPTGGCPKFVVSNPACHFPSWNSRDIIDNSLQSVDIKNGTLRTVDFGRSTIRALKGNVGPAGPAGPGGPAGPAGAQGPAGPVKLTYVSSGLLDNPPHTQSVGTASCPANNNAVG